MLGNRGNIVAAPDARRAQRTQAVQHRAGAVAVVACLLAACSASSFAQQANPTAGDPLIEQREASYWLSKIQSAAQRQNYQGVFVFQRGNLMQSSRIAHIADILGNEYERLDVLEGRPRETLRHNDEVVTLYREQHLRVAEKREMKDTFPALLASGKLDVLEAYTLRKQGLDRVAGQECQQLSLEPKDGERYGYRLCADKQTGLLLRAQTVAEGGRVLEQIAFTQVQYGGASDKQKILAAMKPQSGWQQHTVQAQKAQLSAQGWQIASNVKSFAKLKELRRPLGVEAQSLVSTSNNLNAQTRHNKAAATAAQANTAAEVYQVIYSDGLAGVSVFIEPLQNTKVARREGFASRGATNVWMRRQGNYWVTVVGEAPVVMIKQIGQAVQLGKAP